MANKSSRGENGTGSIFFDKNKRQWRAEIHWTDANGKKNRKSFSSKNKSIVKDKLETFKNGLRLTQGIVSLGEDTLFGVYAEYWMNNVKKKELKPKSYDTTAGILKNEVFPYLGEFTIDCISTADVQYMIDQLEVRELSYSTIKKAYNAVNACLRYYRTKTGTFMHNPCEGVIVSTKNQRPQSEIVYFNKAEREKILAESIRKFPNGTSVYRLGWAVQFLMFTGLRFGEGLALTWKDIDFEQKTINVNKNAVLVRNYEEDGAAYKLLNQKGTKTKSGKRVITITKKAEEALLHIKTINAESEYVLASGNGNQITARTFNRMLHSIVDKAGVTVDDRFGAHSLRHTFASMLYEKGVDTKTISELLGHADVSITQNIYIHLEQEQKVRAMNRLDEYLE